jgi:hypothetical protein
VNGVPRHRSRAGDGNRTRTVSLEALGLLALSSLVNAKSGACRAFRVPQRHMAGRRPRRPGGASPCCLPRPGRLTGRMGDGTTTALRVFRWVCHRAASVRAVDLDCEGVADPPHAGVGQLSEPFDEDRDRDDPDGVHVDHAAWGRRVLVRFETDLAHKAADRGGATSARRFRGITASRARTTTGRRSISAISHHQRSPRAGYVVTTVQRLRGTTPSHPVDVVHDGGREVDGGGSTVGFVSARGSSCSLRTC